MDRGWADWLGGLGRNVSVVRTGVAARRMMATQQIVFEEMVKLLRLWLMMS